MATSKRSRKFGDKRDPDRWRDPFEQPRAPPSAGLFLSGAPMTGIGSHQSARMLNGEWLTPPHVLQALGQFDLDPCAPINRPWPMADQHFTAADDGLAKPWEGRVWLNPPYGQQAAAWLERLAAHGSGTALIFARTETAMFFDHVWAKATALLFLRGRLHFHYVDGTRAAANGGAPSVLIAYGQGDAQILRDCGLPGHFVPLPRA